MGENTCRQRRQVWHPYELLIGLVHSMQRRAHDRADAWLQAVDESIIGHKGGGEIAHRGRSLISMTALMQLQCAQLRTAMLSSCYKVVRQNDFDKIVLEWRQSISFYHAVKEKVKRTYHAYSAFVIVLTSKTCTTTIHPRAQPLGGQRGPDPQNLDGPPQLFTKLFGGGSRLMFHRLLHVSIPHPSSPI